MPIQSSEDFRKHLLETITHLAAGIAHPAVMQASATLAAAMEEQVGPFSTTDGSVPAGSARLYIPHYWAIYVHDGRQPFGPRRGTYLCWFKSPIDDPRIQQGYPVRETDVKYLRQVWTKAQFQAALAENRNRQKSGQPPFMILTKFHPGNPPQRFFEDPLNGFDQTVKDEVRRQFEEFVRTIVYGQRSAATCRLSVRF